MADEYVRCQQGDGVCAPDDAVHYWCDGSTLDGYPLMKETAQWAMNVMERDTVMATTKRATCDQYTDVRFVRGNLPPGTIGRYDCVSWAGASHPNVCSAATVTIDRTFMVEVINNSGYEWSNGVEEPDAQERNFRYNWCHESGHSLGFFHHPLPGEGGRFDWYTGATPERQQDCMVSGHIEQDQNWMRYNPHHAAHIANFLGF